MTFEVNLEPAKTYTHTYPLLARSKQDGYGHIVLFVDKTQALIVDGGESTYYANLVGNVEGFVSYTNDAVWEVLPKGTTVTFTQG